MATSGTTGSMEENDPVSKEEGGESSSTGSSSGKGSGSRGGYSADCSDQSSSDDAGRKKKKDGAKKKESLSKEVERISLEEDKQEIKMPSKGTSKLAFDIDEIVNHKRQVENLVLFPKEQILPQVNGVKVAHPMDPRIDLSQVNYEANAPVAPALPLVNTPLDMAVKNDVSAFQYNQLLQVVRPFFQMQNPVVANSAPFQQARASHAEEKKSSEESSEGFTSFFTTTHTSAGQSTESSDQDKLKQQQQRQQEIAHSDSSMKVHARVKSKHKKKNGSSGESASSGEKRVRIQDEQAQNESSSSSGNQAPRNNVVTDISSTNKTDSSKGTTSGSSGNTGSGSNLGSSNEERQSGEDKGDSDEAAKKKAQEHIDGVVEAAPLHPEVPETARKSPTHSEASQREIKIQEKKRKRIEMRREYEAQQQMESSESSGPKDDTFFPPGKAILLEQALTFSKIPRLVVQALPPFIVVHANAAFSKMTEIDAHAVVSKSVDSVLRHTRKTLSKNKQEEKADTGDSKSSLEQLISSCGSAQVQRVNVATNNPLLGRKVTVSSRKMESNEDGSNDTSLTSSCNDQPTLPCRLSIAPIVSPIYHVEHDSEHRKRRRHNEDHPKRHSPVDSPRSKDQQIVTHFVMQFEELRHEEENEGGGSISTKSEQRDEAARDAPDEQVNDRINTDSATEASEAVVTVG